MSRSKAAAPVALCVLITLVAGCGRPAPHGVAVASSAPAAADVAVALRSAEIAIQSRGLIQVTPALTWAPAVVAADAPIGERLHPSWSPDGTRLAFAGDDADGTRDIWVADRVIGRAVRLVSCDAPCVWVDDPTWSPDGTRVAFVQGETDAAGIGVGTIRSVTTAGDDEVVHFTAAPTEYPFAIDWSPRGDAFAAELVRFASLDVAEEEVTGSAVAIVGLDGQAEPVTDYRDGLGYPSWSPDAESVLVSDDDLWSMDLRTRERSWLAGVRDGGGRALQGTYTPDGGTVVFVQENPQTGAPIVSAVPAGGGAVLGLGEGTHPQVRP